MVGYTLFAALATMLSPIVLADFKIVQVDSYPAQGGAYGGVSATQSAVAAANGGTPSCGQSAGNGFGCDGCGYVSNDDGTPGDSEVGLSNPFHIVGDGGGDFCSIPSMTCSDNGNGGLNCYRDDDGTVQATCTPDEGAFDSFQCDDINGTSEVSAFLTCVGPACD